MLANTEDVHPSLLWLFLRPAPYSIPDPSQASLYRQSQTTAGRPNSRNLANLAHRALVLGVVLDTTEWTARAGLPSVDGCV